ncbi:histidinol dehydrogenase, partial [bacterium]|nr:histidinol dehydrogenase [bacterium]
CFSPLSVTDFTKKSSIIFYDKENLRKDGQKIASLAILEGLEAHARSIEVRNEEGSIIKKTFCNYRII